MRHLHTQAQVCLCVKGSHLLEKMQHLHTQAHLEQPRKLASVCLCVCSCMKKMQHLRHTVTRCDTLQHTATSCNTLKHCSTLMQHTATHCNLLQLAATCCNTSQHTAAQLNTLQHAETLQHTATHPAELGCRGSQSWRGNASNRCSRRRYLSHV